jgi:hypothetical protein
VDSPSDDSDALMSRSDRDALPPGDPVLTSVTKWSALWPSAV